jgi:hypothetical protein
MNLNPYNKDVFKKDAGTKQIAKKVYELFGPVELNFDTVFDTEKHQADQKFKNTSTETFANTTNRWRWLEYDQHWRVFSMVPFYYLRWLQEINPDQILDIGCGSNYFKLFYPNIHGVDLPPWGQNLDEHAHFNKSYSDRNQERWSCAFSINSLHFVSIDKVVDRILKFANVIKPGGRGFITFNLARVLENTFDKSVLLDLFGTTSPSEQQISDYMDHTIKTLSLNFLCIDNIITQCYDEGLNGNLRLVFEK